MRSPNDLQLVGALGSWLKAEGARLPPQEISVASSLVLECGLLGVRAADLDAPELAPLDDDQRAVVDQARSWALARQEAALSEQAERDAELKREREREREEAAATAEREAAAAEVRRAREQYLVEAAEARRRERIRLEAQAAAAARAEAGEAAARIEQAQRDTGEAEARRDTRIVPMETSDATTAPRWLTVESPATDGRAGRRSSSEHVFWWAVCAVALVTLVVLRFF